MSASASPLRAALSALRPLLALELLRLSRQPVLLLLLALSPVLIGVTAAVAGGEAVKELSDDEDEPPLQVAGPEALADWITSEDRLVMVEEAEALAWVRFDDDDADDADDADDEHAAGGANIQYKSSKKSRDARSRLREVLKRWRAADRDAAWAQAGAPITADELLAVERADIAPPDERRGLLLGRLLPSLLVFVCFINGLYVALDALSGERERGTLETLMVSAPSRELVLLAKLLVIWGVVALSALLSLLSLGVGLRFGALGEVLGASLPPEVVLLCLPLTLFIAALLGVCAAWLPDYRSSQIASIPLMAGLQVPAAISLLPGSTLQPIYALLPIVGPSLALREGLAGQLSLPMFGLVFAATCGWSAALIALGARFVARDEVLFGGGPRGGRRARGQLLPEVLGVFALAVVATLLLASPAQALSITWGLLFSQTVIIGGFALGALVWLGLPAASTLGLRRPTARDLALSAGVGLSAWGVSLGAVALLDPLLPASSTSQQALEQAFTGVDSLPVALFFFAVLPAIFEELLFRGALQGMLRRSLSLAPRFLLVSALFALIHLDYARLAPTFAIGLILSFARWRTGSLWSTMLIHFLNNGLLMVLLFQEGELLMPPWWALALAALVCGLCLWGMGRGSEEEPAEGGRAAAPQVN